MLTLKHVTSGEEIPHPVDIEKVVVVPEPELHDLQASNDSLAEIEHNTPTPASVSISPDNALIQVAFQFGKYLQSLPSKSATASQASLQICLFIYYKIFLSGNFSTAWQFMRTNQGIPIFTA